MSCTRQTSSGRRTELLVRRLKTRRKSGGFHALRCVDRPTAGKVGRLRFARPHRGHAGAVHVDLGCSDVPAMRVTATDRRLSPTCRCGCDVSGRHWSVPSPCEVARSDRKVGSASIARVRQTPCERVQGARRLLAAQPAPPAESATVGTQAGDVFQDALEPPRVRAQCRLTPAFRAVVELIHRLENQPAPSGAMNQAQQGSCPGGNGVAHSGQAV